MKLIQYITLIILGLVLNFSFAQEKIGGMEFFHGTFQQALEQAKAQDKIIFMDAFTSWCGPCKRMAASTFPDHSVGEYYNSNFINLKVDMEKEEGPSLAQQYSVKSYPTLLYLDSDGKVVHRASGMRGPEDFIELGKEAMKKIDKSSSFEKMYNEGKKDGETILAYIKSLNAAGKPSLKVANDYLITQKDLTTPINLDIIFESTKEADTKIFDYFAQNKSEYLKKRNPAVIDAKIYQACMKTFQKAIEYRNEELLKIAQEKIKFHSSKANEFKMNTDLEFYAKMNEPTKFSTAAKTFVKSSMKDASKLTQVAQMCIDYFRTNSSIIKIAEKAINQAIKLEGSPNQYLLLANVLKLNGKYSKAKDAANKGLTLAREKMLPTYTFEQLLNELNVN